MTHCNAYPTADIEKFSRSNFVIVTFYK